jgi:2-hydroxychromene-2-carboxylate isomerase
MGELISLDAVRSERRRTDTATLPDFYFDLGDPFSYLASERVERILGPVRWIPVAASALRDQDGAPTPAARRERAEASARALRLPLVWPEGFPADTPCALRTAAHASESGVGPRFAMAASRLAFCGGFDLEDPEALAEAAAAAGLSLDDCLQAAGDVHRDAPLRETARILRAHGIRESPAFRVGRRWLEGDSGLLAAAFLLNRREGAGHPMAPLI